VGKGALAGRGRRARGQGRTRKNIFMPSPLLSDWSDDVLAVGAWCRTAGLPQPANRLRRDAVRLRVEPALLPATVSSDTSPTGSDSDGGSGVSWAPIPAFLATRAAL